jgi:hypothetical protein
MSENDDKVMSGEEFAAHVMGLAANSPGEFKPYIFLNCGGELEIYWEDEMAHGEWKGDYTLMRCRDDNRVTGIVIPLATINREIKRRQDTDHADPRADHV